DIARLMQGGKGIINAGKLGFNNKDRTLLTKLIMMPDSEVIYQLPEELRKRLRTNNTIERVNQEIRRRDRVIRIFPNDLSVLRLMG
ncbi:transposase, partial [Klebsiella pneumoniae]|nr:transposase [Klebsiella pneumoniae]